MISQERLYLSPQWKGLHEFMDLHKGTGHVVTYITFIPPMAMGRDENPPFAEEWIVGKPIPVFFECRPCNEQFWPAPREVTK